MTTLSDLKVFTTHPHQCSYLEEQQATTLFIDPATDLDVQTYSQLADAGFRRSGPHIYRPNCGDCNACISVRVPVAEFKPNRNQRKIINRNSDLEAVEIDNIHSDECYQLYHRYICARHRDGDMYPPTPEQYESFLSNELGNTRYFGLLQDGKLVAVAVTDVLENGLSAIYTFFDPDQSKRSLGSYAILWQIKKGIELELPYLYLGYWIKQCQKMSYKSDYRPLQLLVNNRWVSIA
jgi:arginine-tRNA-protein transferase|tara:strand:- start:1210 stop:1917 length:708 start_codon:yes stop_codon:yes gene_type:complete